MKNGWQCAGLQYGLFGCVVRLWNIVFVLWNTNMNLCSFVAHFVFLFRFLQRKTEWILHSIWKSWKSMGRKLKVECWKSWELNIFKRIDQWYRICNSQQSGVLRKERYKKKRYPTFCQSLGIPSYSRYCCFPFIY